MASNRIAQLSLLLVLLVLVQPSFAHTHSGILRKTGGRKMLVNQFQNKGTNKMPDGSASMISGNDAADLKEVTFEVPEKHHMNVHQVATLEAKEESTLKADQHDEEANYYYTKKYESKEFVDAENLMWKDYSGKFRPRRKPPIHNYNPTTKP